MPPDDDNTLPGRRPGAPRPPAPPARRVAPRAPVPDEAGGDDRTQPRGAAPPARPAPAAPPRGAQRPAARPPAQAQPSAVRKVAARAAPSGSPARRPALPPDAERTRASGGGVLPETGPVRTATLAEKIVSGAQRSWGMTAGAVGGAVFLGVFGMWLIGRGHPVFGVIVMAAIVPLTFTALFIRKAPCPACQTSITVIGIDRCSSCGVYVYLDGQVPTLCESGFIAPLATFAADIPLPIIPRIVWPEAGYCIVCGERAGREETLDIQGNLIPVPHCGDHQDGVTWNMGISETAVTIIQLKFQSFGYWQRFMAANEVHTRQGMWR